MNQREILAVLTGIAPVVREYFESAAAGIRTGVADLTSRLKLLEDKAPAPGLDEAAVLLLIASEMKRHPVEIDAAVIASIVKAEVASAFAALTLPKDGKDADPADVARMVEDAVAKVPLATPGKDADMAAITAAITAEVAKAVAALPIPENGKDADLEMIGQLVDTAVSKIPPAPAGKDVDMEAVSHLVTEQVTSTLAAWPRPKDGTSVTVDEILPIVGELIDRAIGSLPKPKDGKDGVGLAGGMIDRTGALVLTMTDGSTKELGAVVGKDVDMERVALLISQEVAKIPVPKDGTDGVGFDDLSVTCDGEREFTLRFERGEHSREFKFTLPVIIDRGVWREGNFVKGDAVTWGGSLWIAQRDTAAKPEGNDDWRLSTKRGRDGASAYDMARKLGFKGSERDWVASLKGKDGEIRTVALRT